MPRLHDGASSISSSYGEAFSLNDDDDARHAHDPLLTPGDTSRPSYDGRITDISKPEEGAAILPSVFNLANAALGAGVLAFPYAFYNAGMLGCVLLTFLLVCLSLGSLHILAVAAHKHVTVSYQALVFAAFGRAVQVFLNISIALYGFGTCATFLTVISDQLDPIARLLHCGADESSMQSSTDCSLPWYLNSNFLLFAVGTCVVFPLILLRRISLLSYSSIAATCAVLYLTVMIFVYSLIGTTDNNGNETLSIIHDFEEVIEDVEEWVVWKLSFFNAAPIIAFAFQCHMSSMPIYYELHERSPRRMLMVSASAMTVCFVVYITAGLFGYATFGSDTSSDVLLDYSDSSIPAIIARCGMALVAACSYPLLHFVSRLAIQDTLPESMQPLNNTKYLIEWRQLPTTVIFYVLSLVVAMWVPSISIVIGLIGSTIAVLVMFIIPGLLLLLVRCLYCALTKLILGQPQGIGVRDMRYRGIGLFYVLFGLGIGSLSFTVSLWLDIEEYLL